MDETPNETPDAAPDDGGAEKLEETRPEDRGTALDETPGNGGGDDPAPAEEAQPADEPAAASEPSPGEGGE
jgi:hypothetical protein